MDFSIIIPAKNEAANITRCLESIRDLNYPQECFEVLVIDNGSSDRTVEIARELGARVFLKPGVTISALRNFGAAQAKGAVLAFLDADCSVAGDWLARAGEYLPREDVVAYGSPAEVPANGTWVQQTWFCIRGKSKVVEEVEWLESANLFVRKEDFQVVEGFNQELITCEDYDLSLRLSRRGRLLTDSRIRAFHHREPATIVEFFRKELWRGMSNFAGLRSHGVRLSELPSLLLPIIYALLALLTVVTLVSWQSGGQVPLVAGAFWQIPIAMLAFWKIRQQPKLLLAARLFLLLNVYFLARGGAMFRRGRRVL